LVLFRALYLSRNGLRFSLVTQNQIERFIIKKVFFIKLKSKLSLIKQLEIFEFLALYYSDGQNIYSLLLQYQKFASREIKDVCKFVLAELRRGQDFTTILRESNLFCEEIVSSLTVNRLAINQKLFEKMVVILRARVKNTKDLVNRLTYPTVLLMACFGMIVFVSYNILPNFMLFFQDSGQAVPFLLRIISREYLWIVVSFLAILVLMVYFAYKLVPVKVKAETRLINYLYKAKFQTYFWQIALMAIETGVPLEELISEYIKQEKKGINVYYLSTIFSRLTMGLSLEKALEIKVIPNKQRVLSVLATDNERKMSLYKNFIIEAEEKQRETQGLLANLISSFSIAVIALVIIVLGYVMIIPLSQISETI